MFIQGSRTTYSSPAELIYFQQLGSKLLNFIEQIPFEIEGSYYNSNLAVFTYYFHKLVFTCWNKTNQTPKRTSSGRWKTFLAPRVYSLYSGVLQFLHSLLVPDDNKTSTLRHFPQSVELWLLPQSDTENPLLNPFFTVLMKLCVRLSFSPIRPNAKKYFLRKNKTSTDCSWSLLIWNV